MPEGKKSSLIGFVGSSRKNGNTTHVVRYALSLAKEKQIKVKQIPLPDLKIFLCGTQCNYECLRKQNCPITDDV